MRKQLPFGRLNRYLQGRHRNLRIRQAVCALVGTIAVSGSIAPPAGADVFHGYWIKGRIEEAYHRLGGFERFGDALTGESDAALGGKFQVFQKDSSIYWHPVVDRGIAHQVGGRIRDKWGDLAWEAGLLGYPVTDELTAPDGVGRFNGFEGGSIYWSPQTDAHQIAGLILDKWGSLGFEAGRLGYPTTDELTPPDGVGRFNHFSGGSIYFHPEHGTHPVSGAIRDYWSASGWETGRLGYPVSDPTPVYGGTRQDFVGGSIQAIVPTGVSLPAYDNAEFSSYRQVRPLFAKDEHPDLTPQGLNREVLTHMNAYFPLGGCPDSPVTGTTCTFTGVDGTRGRVKIERIADTGFSLATLPGHPEGSGRLLTFRFDEVTAPATAAPEANTSLLFDSNDLKSEYSSSNGTWIRLVIEATGPTSDTAVAGPFSSDHAAEQLFGSMSTAVRDKAPQSTTTYVIEHP